MSKHQESKKSKKREKKEADTDSDIVEEYGQSDRNASSKKKKHHQSKSGGKAIKKSSRAKSSKRNNNDSGGDSEEDDSEESGSEGEQAISDKFRKAVISYIKYDNKSRQLRELQGQLNKKKKELSEMIIGKMDDTHMKTIAITGGKLHRNKAETQAPLKQEMIFKTLKKEIGKSKAKDLMAKIQEQRPMTTRINLKRIKDRKDNIKKASSSSKHTSRSR